MYSLVETRDAVHAWMERFGVRFGIYKDNKFKEQIFPFDPIPRVISADEWAFLERGLIQRVDALNLFLADLYGEKNIIKSGIIPEEFIYSSKGYLPQCEGIKPALGIASHISGIDLVQAEDGRWFILEDNLRVPSGASYPMIARTITSRINPETFTANAIANNRNYAELLKNMMNYVNQERGLNVILTPGRYNSAFFEHSYLAERMGATLAFPEDLVVENGMLYYKDLFNARLRVGALYRRISDEYLDPLVFEPSSLLGVAGLMEVYAAGNVAIVNAPGNGVADDKGIYYFVPKMIEYYLGEEPILENAPTYLPYYPDDLAFTLENIKRLVIKDVSEAGGYGVVFGKDFEGEELEKLCQLIKDEPRRWIAQEVINFRDLETMDEHGVVYRKADLRAFVLSGEKTVVWKSGLTRFAREAQSFVVNSSQGGGFKDTWVMKG
ncbi:MAG: circularly permuted type 2 ATP-grasp protein [Pseudomonadota bacterium]